MKRRYKILAGAFAITLSAIALFPKEAILLAQEPTIFLRAVEVHVGRLFLGKSINLVFDGSTVDANLTTLTVTDPTATRTFTLPDATVNLATTQLPASTGGIPTVYYAGNTTGAASAATSQVSTTGHCYFGQVTLSAGSATVDTLPIPFTGTDTYSAFATYGNGSTGTANVIVAKTSTSKITITGTGSAIVGWGACGY